MLPGAGSGRSARAADRRPSRRAARRAARGRCASGRRRGPRAPSRTPTASRSRATRRPGSRRYRRGSCRRGGRAGSRRRRCRGRGRRRGRRSRAAGPSWAMTHHVGRRRAPGATTASVYWIPFPNAYCSSIGMSARSSWPATGSTCVAERGEVTVDDVHDREHVERRATRRACGRHRGTRSADCRRR